MNCNCLYILVNIKIITDIRIDAMIDMIKRIIIRPRLWSWKHHNNLIGKIHNWNWKKINYSFVMPAGGAAVNILILDMDV